MKGVQFGDGVLQVVVYVVHFQALGNKIQFSRFIVARQMLGNIHLLCAAPFNSMLGIFTDHCNLFFMRLIVSSGGF